MCKPKIFTALCLLLCVLFGVQIQASIPEGIYFTIEQKDNGHLVTITNIDSEHQGNWRIAITGENSTYFRINNQRADFIDHSSHYVSLPNNLAPGSNWSFLLTANGLDSGNYTVDLTLWTTQGRPQHPFNGTVLGSATLFVTVNEDKDKPKENDEEEDEGDSSTEEDIPETEHPYEPEPDDPPYTGTETEPEVVIPDIPEVPEIPEEPDYIPNLPPEYPEENVVSPEEEVTAEKEFLPPASAPLAPIIINENRSYEEVQEIETDEIPGPQNAAVLQELGNMYEPENYIEYEFNQVQDKNEPAPPMLAPEMTSISNPIQNPQTSDNKNIALPILSLFGLIFFAVMIFCKKFI
ncbi:MAG: hypothetical protein FWE24_08180 [Defluviitaleaceae bacterium]|nr:hypothetical protein [Defluviitaleaceae bacterium]